MVVLAHIKEQLRLSLGSYGRPRMTEELKEVDEQAHRRVGRLMRENGIVVERTRKLKATTDSDHNCYDNAAVETFFQTIKAELIWRRSWETRRQAETAIFQGINGFYNPRRRHSALGAKAPWPSNAKGPKRARPAAQIRDRFN